MRSFIATHLREPGRPRRRPQGFHPSLARAAGSEHRRVFRMSEKFQSTYDRLCKHARETAILNSMQGLLGWDERTKLPPAGGEYRAEQMSYLAGLIHKKQTAPEVGEGLNQVMESPPA